MLEQLKGPYPYALSILHIIPGGALSQGEKITSLEITMSSKVVKSYVEEEREMELKNW